jgi:hypothetical protein
MWTQRELIPIGEGDGDKWFYPTSEYSNEVLLAFLSDIAEETPRTTWSYLGLIFTMQLVDFYPTQINSYRLIPQPTPRASAILIPPEISPFTIAFQLVRYIPNGIVIIKENV